MITIYKYPLRKNQDYQTINMPQFAEILTIDMQFGEPMLWAQINTENRIQEYKFYFGFTGCRFLEDPSYLENVGMFQLNKGVHVVHVFKMLR